MVHNYQNEFMKYASKSSSYAAKTITSILYDKLTPISVLDIGCAEGEWLQNWSDRGVRCIFGIDGDYVNRNNLKIPIDKFLATDLADKFNLERTFDLVQCLEVAEHIPFEKADVFITNLVGHAEKYILFSAAPPGQGGEYHVNEQPYEYWRQKLRTHNFFPVDFIRPLIKGDNEVSYWYRYNTLLYVKEPHLCKLDDRIKGCIVNDDKHIKDISPNLFKLRKFIIARMPLFMQSMVAKIKAKILPTGKF